MSEQSTSVELDLFGAPVKQIRERWGRASFSKNNENQGLVALLSGAGWSQKRIASYIGCDEKTLRKHFSRELSAGGDMIEAEALQVLYKQMRLGKSPALNRLLDVIDNGRAAPPPSTHKPDDEKIGKKEELNRRAATPTDGWGETLQ